MVYIDFKTAVITFWNAVILMIIIITVQLTYLRRCLWLYTKLNMKCIDHVSLIIYGRLRQFVRHLKLAETRSKDI